MNKTISRKKMTGWKNITCLCFSLLLCSTLAYAQGITVTGTVVDNLGETLPGVSVSVKGTTLGGITDINGIYNVTVPNRDAILVFSSIGFDGQEITVGNRTQINVTLNESSQQLEEVIVVGFGTTTRATLTGAISTVSATDIESRPVAHAAQALQGLVPGLNVDITTGALQARPSFNVRGPGTIGSGSSGSPLVIIDGLEGDINNVSPNDIDNISVLKDAAASAIYGSKAAFGVIMVTTKRGKAASKASVNYSYNLRLSSPIRMPKMVDSWSFMHFANDAIMGDGKTARFTPDVIENALKYQRGEITYNNTPEPGNPNRWREGYESGFDNVDYIKVIFRDVSTDQEHMVSASGGVGNLTYYTSLNYLDRSGFVKWQQDKSSRTTTNVRLNYELNKWVSINYSNRFTRSEVKRPQHLDQNETDFFYTVIRQSWPNFPLYDPYGNLWAWHPLNLRDGGTAYDNSNQFVQSLQAVIEPIKKWKTFVQYSSTLIYRDRKNVNNGTFTHHNVDGTPYPYSTTGNSAGFVNERRNYTGRMDFSAYSEYQFSLKKMHNFKVMAGMQSQKVNMDYVRVQRGGLQSKSLPVINLTTGFNSLSATSITTPSIEGTEDHYASMGFFGRVNYDINNKYLLELNARYDGSSRFRAGHRWTINPSAAIAWNIAQETFMQPFEHFLSQLKIRVSYGSLANQNTDGYYPTYQDMALSSLGSEWVFENGQQVNIARAPTRLENPYMGWEQVSTTNIGLDYGFFKQRLSGSFELFRRNTDKMIGPAETRPATIGASVPRENNTSMKDEGFEFTIGWRDRLKSGVTYSIRFNIQDSKTVITKYPNPTGTISTGITDQYNAGYQTNNIWGYTTLGIAKSQAEIDAHLASLPNGGQSAIASVAWRAGDIMYKDINGLGRIYPGASTIYDHGNLSIIGNATPRYRFGLDMNVQWKGIDLRVFLQGVGKRDYWINSMHMWGASGGDWDQACFTSHLDYFRESADHPLGQNLNSYYPTPYNTSNRNRAVQTAYLQDASYIRLKNLQLGYTIPAKISNKVLSEKLRIYFSGENLATLTKLISHLDPETIAQNSRGLGYPLSRVISFGISTNF